MTKTTDYLNQLPEDEARVVLSKCCAAGVWVDEMIHCRPFADDAALAKVATDTWNGLDHDGWLEAFEAHPRIGDVDSLRAKYGDTKNWAQGEQAGATVASDETLTRLAELNDRYYEKFRYIFIVCATGKSADEMLTILEGRLPNDQSDEIRIAADQQLKITLLRLQKLVE